jgi:hypothetical protein
MMFLPKSSCPLLILQVCIIVYSSQIVEEWYSPMASSWHGRMPTLNEVFHFSQNPKLALYSIGPAYYTHHAVEFEAY